MLERMEYIHLNINSLLPKIEELCIIAKSTYAAIIGISESKLDEYVLEPEIEIDDYKILRCDRNRQRGGVACYIRSDLSYNIISVFPSESESVFIEIMLPNSKPNSNSIVDHILASYPERVTQQGIIDVGLSDHQLIFCTRKIPRIKRSTHKHIKFRSFKHYSADLFKETLTSINFPN